jgi:hypothetical protein
LDGILARTVKVFGNASAGGGISNSGTISAGGTGIKLQAIATLSGGIGNSGAISGGDIGIRLLNDTTFSGGISNRGTISARNPGIEVEEVTTFSGGIVNSSGGRIASKSGDGIFVRAVVDFGNTSAGGGISNSGAISAGDTGIRLAGVATAFGGISNSGNIAAGIGIVVATVADFGNAGAGGGISNSGTISANHPGIDLFDVTTFSGGIGNTGKIASKSGNGIFVDFGMDFGNTSTGGGISNSGTISAGHTGIRLASVATAFGGISNSGMISAGLAGIDLFDVSIFSAGGLINTGAISAKTGIAITDSTIQGAIINSGTIRATSQGILIGSASEILATKTAIDIAGGVFTGGISNFGVISGSAGIEIKTAHPVSIFDAGAILASHGGTAIQFAGSGNTLTLGAGYTISGTVDPSGQNIF